MNPFDAGFKAGQLWQRMVNAPVRKKGQAFVAYAEYLIQMKEEGVLPLVEAAYSICGSIMLDHVYDRHSYLAAVMDIACDLELPATVRSEKDEEGAWQKMKEYLQEYKKKYPTRLTYYLEIYGEQSNKKKEITSTLTGFIFYSRKGAKVQVADPGVRAAIEQHIQNGEINTSEKKYLQDLKKKLDDKEVVGYRLTLTLSYALKE